MSYSQGDEDDFLDVLASKDDAETERLLNFFVERGVLHVDDVNALSRRVLSDGPAETSEDEEPSDEEAQDEEPSDEASDDDAAGEDRTVSTFDEYEEATGEAFPHRDRLEQAGVTTVEDVLEHADLEAIDGIGASRAEEIVEAATAVA